MIFNLTKRKIVILIIAIVVIGAGIFLVMNKEPKNIPLDLAGKNDSEQSASENNLNQADGNTGQENVVTEEIIDENGEKTVVKVEDIDINKIQPADTNVFANITTEHCTRDCEAFANKLDYFEYCQQVCGIAPEKNVSNCDGKKELQKDYCLKDLGIKKIDKSICEKIEDANIKNTCKNRIAQEQIESQMHELVD